LRSLITEGRVVRNEVCHRIRQQSREIRVVRRTRGEGQQSTGEDGD
jgi:hypothetical protein